MSRNSPRTIRVKFAGKCACCGGRIGVGEMADYDPVKRQIWHYRAMEGNSGKCTAEIRQRGEYVRDPGEDAADRWNEIHGDRF